MTYTTVMERPESGEYKRHCFTTRQVVLLAAVGLPFGVVTND